eukprot:11865897-Ditylum_brightwellii.AAC.1
MEMDALLDVADDLCYEELVTYICGERKEVLQLEEQVSKLKSEIENVTKKYDKYKSLCEKIDSIRIKM